MPASDSPAVLVARFLKANHYEQTFDAFIKEAGLSEDDGDTKSGDWTLEQILEEKKQFDTSLAFEKHSDSVQGGWTTPAPSIPVSPDISINSATNILCISGARNGDNIFITAADKSVTEATRQAPFHEIKIYPGLHDSPVLSVWPLTNTLYLSASMSGQLTLFDAVAGKVVDKRRDHLKYAVEVICTSDGEPAPMKLVATAGWDQKIHLYSLHTNLSIQDEADFEGLDEEDPDILPEPMHTMSTPSVPESMLFVRHPDTGELYFVFSRRDSTFLYYYRIYSEGRNVVVQEAGRQNLAPHSNAWVAFTPSRLAASPNDATLIAVATSHIPHMKLLVVRLLFPDSSVHQDLPHTQAAMARADLATQDREEQAIMLHVTTLAPQTPYSNPQVVWRPDGSGLWVNGDDGTIRGIELKSGKVVATLQAHEPGTKVRTLWAGRQSEESGGEELLVSGGFDKRVFMWTVSGDAAATVS